ncbi:hypothetical protein KIL84_013752 [Mauremys mutica]|uniref:Uncharacterized protein n=1 Tax=Mauremys mutica TaxID=74926 RepID=A0A9D3WW18_9SAUR|nr:hypothetical protein KIL84_013752 [Mauremys mutica]
MAQGVVYADLRFVKAPRGNTTGSRSQEAAPAEEDDAELTYENVRLPQTGEVKQGQGAEQSKVRAASSGRGMTSLAETCPKGIDVNILAGCVQFTP